VKWDELLALVRRDYERTFSNFERTAPVRGIPRAEAPTEPAVVPELKPLAVVDDSRANLAAMTAGAAQAARVNTVQAVAPLAAAPAAVARQITPPQLATGPLATNAPVAPATPPVKWDELLALVRRDYERTFSNFDATARVRGIPRSQVPTVPAVIPEPNPLPPNGSPEVGVSPPAPASPAPASPAPTSPPLFLGDYSTGDFSQWNTLQNKGINARPSGWPATGNYPAQIVEDPERGYVARYEVRAGDRTSFDASNVNRSEVQASGGTTGGGEGDLRWYSFSVKFDPTFPTNSGGWGVLTNQWHGNASSGAPPVAWYAVGDKWQLTANPQSSPGAYLGSRVLWETPIAPGEWHDIKMAINFSTSDSTGYVQVWHNGVPQRLTNSSYTYQIRTLIPGSSNPTTYYKEGIYRAASSSTAVVYHTGFRSATAETGV
jgi:hypothetical protein